MPIRSNLEDLMMLYNSGQCDPQTDSALANSNNNQLYYGGQLGSLPGFSV